MNRIKCEDPLVGYDWINLYKNYEAKTLPTLNKFINCLKYLDFKPVPSDDRNLYYLILEKLRHNTLTYEIYNAIVYWKMYSTSVSISKKYFEDESLKDKAQVSLCKFLNIVNENNITNRDINKTIRLISWLKDDKNLFGVGYSVASAICHFLYPNIVPIVDRMVIQAIGNNREVSKFALNDIESIKLYIEYNWHLSTKYHDCFKNIYSETPVRIIDMALWEKR